MINHLHLLLFQIFTLFCVIYLRKKSATSNFKWLKTILNLKLFLLGILQSERHPLYTNTWTWSRSPRQRLVQHQRELITSTRISGWSWTYGTRLGRRASGTSFLFTRRERTPLSLCSIKRTNPPSTTSTTGTSTWRRTLRCSGALLLRTKSIWNRWST